MNIDISIEAESKENLINHIVNGKFYNGDFSRYSIEVYDQNKMVATRLTKEKEEETFSFTFVLQEYRLDLESWEDMGEDYIPYVEGKTKDINEIITDKVFDSIIPTMKNILLSITK